MKEGDRVAESELIDDTGTVLDVIANQLTTDTHADRALEVLRSR